MTIECTYYRVLVEPIVTETTEAGIFITSDELRGLFKAKVLAVGSGVSEAVQIGSTIFARRKDRDEGSLEVENKIQYILDADDIVGVVCNEDG